MTKVLITTDTCVAQEGSYNIYVRAAGRIKIDVYRACNEQDADRAYRQVLDHLYNLLLEGKTSETVENLRLAALPTSHIVPGEPAPLRPFMPVPGRVIGDSVLIGGCSAPQLKNLGELVRAELKTIEEERSGGVRQSIALAKSKLISARDNVDNALKAYHWCVLERSRAATELHNLEKTLEALCGSSK